MNLPCGGDKTTLFLHSGRSSDYRYSQILGIALELLDWAIALPKLEERKFIYSYDAELTKHKYEGMLDIIEPILEIRE